MSKRLPALVPRDLDEPLTDTNFGGSHIYVRYEPRQRRPRRDGAGKGRVMSKRARGTRVKKTGWARFWDWYQTIIVVGLFALVHFSVGIPQAWNEIVVTLGIGGEEQVAKYRQNRDILYTPDDPTSYTVRLPHPTLCNELRYTIHEPSVTPERQEALFAAVAEIEAAAGVKFHFDGYTQSRETPVATTPGVTPLVVAWVPKSELSGKSIGNSAISPYTDPSLLSGRILMHDKIPNPRVPLLHELSHHLGLGHTKDSGQIMYPQSANWAAQNFGAGDLAGFKALKELC